MSLINDFLTEFVSKTIKVFGGEAHYELNTSLQLLAVLGELKNVIRNLYYEVNDQRKLDLSVKEESLIHDFSPVMYALCINVKSTHTFGGNLVDYLSIGLTSIDYMLYDHLHNLTSTASNLLFRMSNRDVESCHTATINILSRIIVNRPVPTVRTYSLLLLLFGMYSVFIHNGYSVYDGRTRMRSDRFSFNINGHTIKHQILLVLNSLSLSEGKCEYRDFNPYLHNLSCGNFFSIDKGVKFNIEKSLFRKKMINALNSALYRTDRGDYVEKFAAIYYTHFPTPLYSIFTNFQDSMIFSDTIQSYAMVHDISRDEFKQQACNKHIVFSNIVCNSSMETYLLSSFRFKANFSHGYSSFGYNDYGLMNRDIKMSPQVNATVIGRVSFTEAIVFELHQHQGMFLMITLPYDELTNYLPGVISNIICDYCLSLDYDLPNYDLISEVDTLVSKSIIPVTGFCMTEVFAVLRAQALNFVASRIAATCPAVRGDVYNGSPIREPSQEHYVPDFNFDDNWLVDLGHQFTNLVEGFEHHLADYYID